MIAVFIDQTVRIIGGAHLSLNSNFAIYMDSLDSHTSRVWL